MNDINVIIWVRDMLLANVETDADVVYDAARLAEEDRGMYDLLTDYAYNEGNKYKQWDVYTEIVQYLEDRGL